MRLWLDDVRNPADWLPSISWFRSAAAQDIEDWTWVKTAREAIALLDAGLVKEISLDHDLGDDPVRARATTSCRGSRNARRRTTPTIPR